MSRTLRRAKVRIPDSIYYAQLRRQYQRNLAQLTAMHNRAASTGRKVSGYSADQLAERVAEYRRIVELDDAGMADHLAGTRIAIRARLQELQGVQL